jgi:hypothetical protein
LTLIIEGNYRIPRYYPISTGIAASLHEVAAAARNHCYFQQDRRTYHAEHVSIRDAAHAQGRRQVAARPILLRDAPIAACFFHETRSTLVESLQKVLAI